MDVTSFCAVLAILTFGSAVQGVAGFGMGLLSVPMMLHFLPTTTVPPLSLVVGSFLDAIFLWNLRRFVNWRLVLPVLIGSAFGVLPGILLLKTVPVEPFKLGAGILITASGGLLLLGISCPVKNFWLQLIVGFIAGVFNGSLGVPGAPVAFFLTAGDVPKDNFRASISALFLALNIITLAMMTQQGVLTVPLLRTSMTALPAIFVGSYIGLKLAKFVPQKIFRRIVTLLIVASGVSLIV